MVTIEQGLALHNAGRLDEARGVYCQVLAAEPANFRALELLGTLECQAGRLEEGASLLERSLAIRPDQPDVRYNRGLALQYLRRAEEAVTCFDQVLQQRPHHVQAWYAKGNILQELGRFEDAVASYDNVLALQPDLAEAHSNRAFALHNLRRLEEARSGYERAVALRPGLSESWIQLGAVLHALGQPAEALESLGRGLQLNPKHGQGWFMRGDVLLGLHRAEEAMASYDHTVALIPNHAQAWSNRGNVLQELGRHEEAVSSYGRALSARPDHIEALNNRGNALRRLGRTAEALADFDAVLAVAPAFAWLQGHAFYTRATLADWQDFDTRLTALRTGIEAGEPVTPPFQVQPLIDSPELQQSAANIYARRMVPEGQAMVLSVASSQRDRIRVAYFSSDFFDHPVSHLLAGMFKRHDRTRFEVFVFALAAGPVDSWRERIRGGADHFIEAFGLSDQEIAAKARELEIDIAIDLNGFTQGNRMNAFAARMAPVQASYLGYLGTLGGSCYDYLLADEVIVPADKQPFYNEKIVYLPSFQINDDTWVVQGETFTRAELGLPEDGFIFCSFNQVYKIVPEVFDSWMRILFQVPGSVLWLYVTDARAIANLKAEAQKRGVDPVRLVFAGRVPLEDHLARQRAADLFLDTHPYNAGATASNALRMGLPVLTRIGEAFPARMGASLLRAIGLPELITETPEAYETLAVRLATQPEELAALKRKLAGNLPGSRLFDTERATRDLEAAFTLMAARARNGLPPETIRV
jgi:predicted O-linked N-acetylglucosamine transferase (SPINDLY family)